MEDLALKIKFDECCNNDCDQGRRCPYREHRRRIGAFKRIRFRRKVTEWILDALANFSPK